MTHEFPKGVSTEPEVNLLMQINIEAGEIVAYDRIARYSGLIVGSNRFRSVVAAWCRRVMREQNMQHATVRGVGVRFLTESQALGKGITDTQRTATAVRKIASRVKKIDSRKLSAYEQGQQQLLQKHLRASDHEARMLKKKIALPQPVTASVVRLASSA